MLKWRIVIVGRPGERGSERQLIHEHNVEFVQGVNFFIRYHLSTLGYILCSTKGSSKYLKHWAIHMKLDIVHLSMSVKTCLGIIIVETFNF